jgi:C_GCAxxG_C_C family probable redox protein
MLAVGEHTLGHVDERTLRMTTGFSGGVGRTHRDLCGALSAGIMIIGALHGRTRPDENEDLCQQLATSYRDRFAQELGSVYCHELRAEKYGPQGQEPCSVLVERAARILLAVLEGDGNENDHVHC